MKRPEISCFFLTFLTELTFQKLIKEYLTSFSFAHQLTFLPENWAKINRTWLYDNLKCLVVQALQSLLHLESISVEHKWSLVQFLLEVLFETTQV